AEDSPLAGCSLRDAGLPEGTIVMTLQRDGRLLPCRGDTVLQPGDHLGMLSWSGDAEQVVTSLGGTLAAPDPPGAR
ncbi:MAG: TrkA C-terminal domain-containing protein, partial [Nocardioidaceae bacterium]